MKGTKIILKIFALFLYTLLVSGIMFVVFVLYPHVTTKSSDVFMKNQFNIIKDVLSDKDDFIFNNYKDFNAQYNKNIEKSDYCMVLESIDKKNFIYGFKLKNISFIRQEGNYFIKGNTEISLEQKEEFKRKINKGCNS